MLAPNPEVEIPLRISLRADIPMPIELLCGNLYMDSQRQGVVQCLHVKLKILAFQLSGLMGAFESISKVDMFFDTPMFFDIRLYSAAMLKLYTNLCVHTVDM